MFEKEAEEYLIRNLCKTCLTICENNCPHAESEKRAYKDGAEFGYNKAFVEADKNLKAVVADFNKANEWHYVKDELPNTEFGRADVTIAYINAYENPCTRDCCFDGTNFIYWDARKPVGWKKADIFGKIYAWKYPEKLPELPKEIKEK